MKLCALLIILTLISACLCKKCVINREPADRPQEQALRRHIIHCSDSDNPPVNRNETAGTNHVIIVKMDYLLRSFRFELDEEIIMIYSWNYLHWQDDRLTWDPEDYHGQKKAVVTSFAIWSPGIKLVNTVDSGDFDLLYAKCGVNNTGHVRCVAKAEHVVVCKSFLKNWPYDHKTCDLEFDQWRSGEAKVFFNLSGIIFVVDSYQNEGWEILRNDVLTNVKTGVQSTVKFSLQRLSAGLETTIVVPSFVIAVITVTSLLLDCKGNTRLGIVCLSLLCHFSVSNEISENIPKHSKDTPLILVFISASTVLTIIAFLLSFTFRLLVKRSNQPPEWITSANDLALTSRFKYLVVTNWIDDKDPNNKSKWDTFVGIVSSICFLIYVLTYVCLFVTLMPSRTPNFNHFDIV